MISISQLSMSYGEKLLFFDVNLILNDKTRYALVGANGTGKSTLLKLITGEETSLSGNIGMPKDASIGWLKQNQYLYEQTSITDVVIQGKPKLWKALKAKETLLESPHWGEKEAHRLSLLEETIAHQNGYSALAFAEKLLEGLGIHAEYHSKPLSALSGGYKLRVLLAQTLFQEPNILLLDEPTNHLDIVSIRWFENYLKNEFPGLVLFISHDVEFIDRLANYILDIDYGEIRQYSGNYAKFLAEKHLIEEQKLHIKKNIEMKIAEMQKFVDRFGAKATKAKQAQSRLKQIEKIELELPDIKHSSRVTPHFHFKPAHQSGKTILKVKGLSKEFRNKKLFEHVSFELHRGEKLAIIGENGMGKSTLIKILIDKLTPDAGTHEWGHNVEISYFSQDHHDLLNQHMPLLEWLTHESSCPEQQVRKILGQVLFTKDEVQKDILTLSGGEAARLLLARIMLANSNVLILDEPTNHLDLEATEALADSLANFDGTLIFVSHNRHFISKIAKRIIFLSRDKGVQDFKGTYAEFETEEISK